MEHLTAKKSLGQHFLTNPQVTEKMVAAAKVVRGDTVLEVGPGTGMLTKALLAAGANVIAIEADSRAITILKETFKTACMREQLTLIHDDIRTFDIETLNLTDKKYKVIANIPYYISGFIFEHFLTQKNQPSVMVLLVQKEVAERIARSEKESLLSLSIKTYGVPKYVATVPRGNFTPPPSVNSAVLAITAISRARFPDTNAEKRFFTLLKLGFAARRKQLIGNLRTLADRAALEQAFTALGFDLKVRGEDLSIDDWHALAAMLKKTLST